MTVIQSVLLDASTLFLNSKFPSMDHKFRCEVAAEMPYYLSRGYDFTRAYDSAFSFLDYCNDPDQLELLAPVDSSVPYF